MSSLWRGAWGANTILVRKQLSNHFSQIVDHSLSFFVFPMFSLNKHRWRLPQFSFLENSLSIFSLSSSLCGLRCDIWWLHWGLVRELSHLIECAILSWLFLYLFSLFLLSFRCTHVCYHFILLPFFSRFFFDLVSFILCFAHACINHLLCCYFFVFILGSIYYFHS